MSGCSIRGRVATVLGEPVRKAGITFTSTDFVNRVEYVTATDEAGGFRLDDIDPGQYHLAARKTGYVRAVYGSPTPLTIAPGRAVPDLEMSLAPQAVITGRVFDSDGDPMENVQVRLHGEGAHGQAMTNDLGEFRIAGLASGCYTLSATAADRFGHHGRRVRQGPDDTYADLYYPDTLDPRETQPIDVPAGATLIGYELRMKRAAGFRVSGVVEVPADADPRTVAVHLRPNTMADGAGFGGGHHGGPEFQFDGILPGAHILIAHCNRRGRGAQVSAEVEVVDRDVHGVVVRFASGMTIPGRVSGGPAGFLSVSLNGEGRLSGANASTASDGAFTLEDVPPGRYRLCVFQLEKDAYVKSVSYGGVPVSPDAFDIRDPAPLEIELAYDGGIVSGVVKDSPGAVVNLLRSGESKHWGVADQDARFEIRGIAPGEYVAAAAKSLYRPPPTTGVPVAVAAGARVEVTLEVQ